MATLFNREIKITIEDRQFKDLRVVFNIERTNASTLNNGDIKIYNLNSSSRGSIKKATILGSKTAGSRVVLEAGYIGNTEVLCTGEVVKFDHSKSGPDIITSLQISDGYSNLAFSNIEKSYSDGTRLRSVLNDVADAMGVTGTNSLTVTPELILTKFENGYVATGNPRETLEVICKTIGATWSIQDGQLVISKNGRPTELAAVLVSKETGLIETPRITNEGANFKSLLNPKIKPGVLVNLTSKLFPLKILIIRKCTYTGDNYSSNFFVEAEGTNFGGFGL